MYVHIVYMHVYIELLYRGDARLYIHVHVCMRVFIYNGDTASSMPVYEALSY